MHQKFMQNKNPEVEIELLCILNGKRKPEKSMQNDFQTIIIFAQQ